MTAVVSSLPPEVVGVLAAHRRAAEADAPSKLRLVRRLQLQKVLKELPETRVEQSFNEQLFARVFGYRTLLSHDAAREFHMMPKNVMRARRLDDFSLGYFGGDVPRTLVSAEFKSPGCDLDKPQTSGKHRGISPVQQAFDAACQHATCRFVLVSNFHELRLYTIDRKLVAVADLMQIRTRDDLALLCAHFDRRALLGDEHDKEPEMSVALGGHPIETFSKEPGFYRASWLFTPSSRAPGDVIPAFDQPRALYVIERLLRDALRMSRRRWADFQKGQHHDDEDDPSISITVANGWLTARTPLDRKRSLVVGVSREGQMSLNARIPTGLTSMNATKPFKQVTIDDLSGFFGHLLRTVGADWTPAGEIELSVFDLAGFVMHDAPGKVAVGDALHARTSIHGIPGASFLSTALATCLCDIAVQFRDGRGGVLLNDGELRTFLTRVLNVDDE